MQQTKLTAASQWEQAFYVADLASENPTISNTILTLKLDGHIHRSDLMQAIAHQFQHPSFQLQFKWNDKQLNKQNMSCSTQGLFSDISDQADPVFSSRTILEQMYNARIAPDQAPLFRWHLLYLGELDKQPQHLIVFAIHHIILDGKSANNLMQGIKKDYQALLNGKPLSVHALPAMTSPSVGENAGNDAILDDVLKARCDDLAGRSYYLKLAQQETPHRLATTQTLSLTAKQTQDIRQFVHEQGITANLLFRGIYAALLSYLTGQKDIFILSPTNLRGKENTEQWGCWVNMTIENDHFDDDPTWVQLFATMLKLRRHWKKAKALPLAHVVDHLRKTDPTYNRHSFNIILSETTVLNNQYAFTAEVQATEQYHFIESTQDLQLLYYLAADDTFHFQLNYPTAINQDGLLDNFLQRLVQTLDTVLRQPEAKVSAINFLLPVELHEITQRNHTQVPYPAITLAQAFYQQALTQPDHIALIDDASGQQWTYQQLHDIASGLAQRLTASAQAQGTTLQQQVVMLHIDPLAPLVIAILAVQYAHAIYYCIDQTAPIERKEKLMALCQPRLLLVDQTQDFASADIQIHFLHLLQEVEQDIAKKRAQDRKNHVATSAKAPYCSDRNEDLSHFIFTSGTTGFPKGVALSHRAVMSTLYAPLHLPQSKRILYSANETFDCATLQLWSAWIHGATLITPRRKAVIDLQQMTHLIQAHQPDNIFLTTGLFDSYMQSGKAALFAPVKTVVFGGDVVNPNSVEQALDAGVTEVFNIYGPAETCIYSLAFKAEKIPAEKGLAPDSMQRNWSNVIPLGLISNNMQVLILDPAGRHLPNGACGELYFIGDGLAQGYYRQPELTRAAFVNLYLPELGYQDHVRAYRSGDYGYWGRSGLVFVGRRDDQVKIRGYRIELQEVRQMIEALPMVNLCAVIAPGMAGQRELQAFFTSDISCEIEEIRAQLETKLPEYMVPTVLYQVDTLPLTVNGKFDLRALEVLRRNIQNNEKNSAANTFIAPRNEVEMKLYFIFERLFPEQRIDVNSHFFQLGGSSLDALQLVNLIDKDFGVAITLTTLVQHPTLSKLGALLRQLRQKINPETSDNTPKNLMTFRDGERHLICIHPGGGTAFCYLKLANVVSKHLGIHGVQAQGLNDGEELLPSLDAMADHYLEQIAHLTIQPHVICGWSLGGLIALLMTKKLHDRGVNTALIMFDTNYPSTELIKSLPEVPLEQFIEKLRRFDGMFPDIRQSDLERYWRLYNYNWRLLESYHVARYDGPALLLIVHDPDYNSDVDSAIHTWKKVIPSLRTQKISGDHWTLMDPPHIQEVAKFVEATIAEHCDRWGEK